MAVEFKSACNMLLISYPSQGHMNPTLRLGKKLASKGLHVTIYTTLHFGRSLKNAGSIGDGPSPVGPGFIEFEFWDDGCAEDDPRRRDVDAYMRQMEVSGKAALAQILGDRAGENRPVSCLIAPFMPWISDVAHNFGIPYAYFWVQSCSVFSIFYHYNLNPANFPSESDPYCDLQLPFLPLLKHDEIPTFLHPHAQFKSIAQSVLRQFRNESVPFCVLMDTFDELEQDVITHMAKIFPVKAIGPLFKPLKVSVVSDISGDSLKADDCLDWLDLKPPNSVVYIAFGSLVHLGQKQIDEIAHALCDSGFPFLWVMKPLSENMAKSWGLEAHVLPEGFMEKCGERGKIVKWSPQQKVLSHPSVGCFVTHCGWNSSLEALSSGVPVLVMPQWGDQVTNAKFLVEEFGVGLRLSRGAAEKKLLGREELEKCLREVMEAEDLRQNALNWKNKADAATADGGSSDTHIQHFLDAVKSFRSTV